MHVLALLTIAHDAADGSASDEALFHTLRVATVETLALSQVVKATKNWTANHGLAVREQRRDWPAVLVRQEAGAVACKVLDPEMRERDRAAKES